MKGFGRIGSGVIAGATAAIVIAVMGITGSQAAWTDNEFDNADFGALDCVDGTGFTTSAWGKFAAAFVGGQDIAPIADLEGLTVDSGDPTSTATGADAIYLGEDAWVSEVDLAALSTIEVSQSIPLFETSDTGVYTQYGQSHQAGQSTGASGLLTDSSGGVTLGSADPDAPTVGSVDLSSALDEVIADSTVVDPDQLATLGMTIGAVSSLTSLDACAALWDGADLEDYLVREYLISALSLDFGSSLVTDLADALVTLIGTLGNDLDGVIDQEGLTGQLLTDVTGLVNGALDDLDATLGVLSPFGGGVIDTAIVDVDFDLQPVLDLLDDVYSSDDGSVTVDLGNGTITADIGTLSGGLNGRDPNSSLLTAAVLSGISTGVGEALANFVALHLLPALEDALLDATVTLALGSTVTILGQGVTLSTTVTGSAGQFTGVSPGVPVVDTVVTADGTVLAALELLLPGVLNGLLDTITQGVTDGIVDELLTTVVPAVGSQLLQPLLDQGGGLDLLLDQAITQVTGTLIPGLIAALGPVFDLLGDLVQLSVNVQPDQGGDVPFPPPPATAVPGRWFESALRFALLDLGADPLVAVYLASSSAGPNALTP
jgi:hypothetical protein